MGAIKKGMSDYFILLELFYTFSLESKIIWLIQALKQHLFYGQKMLVEYINSFKKSRL